MLGRPQGDELEAAWTALADEVSDARLFEDVRSSVVDIAGAAPGDELAEPRLVTHARHTVAIERAQQVPARCARQLVGDHGVASDE